VITYLKSLTGKNTLSGQQGGSTGNPAQWVTKVHDITGQYPGLSAVTSDSVRTTSTAARR
jgi:mannan endo-1,4-beta-mannosidase